MRTYQTFAFMRYGFDAKTSRITLEYALESGKRGVAPVWFVETIDLPKEGLRPRAVPKELLDRALRLLHLLGGVSYFKTCLPKEIAVKTGDLTPEETRFLTTVYEEGLGEFFFVNELDPRERVHFPAGTADPPEPLDMPQMEERILVPFGGGKDSVVTAQLLKDAGLPVTLFRMNAHPAIDALASAMKLPLLTVQRTIDKQLLEMNAKGALNGHVPITAYMHALTLVIALLYGYSAVAFSDERSADVGSTTFHGKQINHQWSKGLQFERMFQEHAASHITPDIPVFSLLRPWSELMIVQRFSELRDELTLATSCNENWKLSAKPGANIWCGKCPKCAFAFAMLAAWLPASRVISIIGSNCFADKKLLPTYRQLLGIEGIKPFECVGTKEETRAAFLLAADRGDLKTTSAMRMFEAECRPQIADRDALLQEVLSPVADHAIPPTFSTIIPERPPIRLA